MSIWDRDDIRQAFVVQLDARASARLQGGVPLGWKLGYGSPAARRAAGISAPLIGHLLEANRIRCGGTWSLDGWVNPHLEPEIAVYIGADVPANASGSELLAAISGMSLAFELIDIDRPLADVPAAVAGNIFQRGVMLGQRMPVRLPPPPVTITRDNEVLGCAVDPGTTVGDIALLVQHVADTLDACGQRLRAGEVIITGTVIPAIPPIPAGYAMSAEGLGRLDVVVTA